MEKLKILIKKSDAKSKKTTFTEKEGFLSAVLYGPKVKSQPISMAFKEFEKVYEKSGGSSLISLVDEDKKEFLVLVHDIQRNPLSSKIIHVDFYAPILTEIVEARVPLVFEGEAPAVKDLSGTLVKEFQEVEVKALPQDLPHEIKVNIGGLKTFEDEILVKDLELPKGVEVLKEPDAIVVSVLPPEKVEEELEKPIEEKVEDVEVVEKEGKEMPEDAAVQPVKEEGDK
jgi:large subunit ribosomal protein L25